MDKIDIVRRAFNLSTTVEEQRSYLTDDFQFSDSTGGPTMDLKAWNAMSDLMRTSLPDLGYVIDEINQEGDDVIYTGHFTGTFKNDLNLTTFNMGVIKATGKAVKFPNSTNRVSFRGDKISANKDLTTGPISGTAAFLSALGGEG
jgi:predicted ester cyclase